MKKFFKNLLCFSLLMLAQFGYAASDDISDSSSILIIIDMQEKFSASQCEEAQNCIAQEIKNAISQGIPILFVNMKMKSYETKKGKNIKILRDLVSGYDKVYTVQKFFSSGSRAILTFLKSKNLEGIKELRVCGINTGACVEATVRNLLESGDFEILNLIEAGCASECFIRDEECDCQGGYCRKSHERYLEKMIKDFVIHKNFHVVYETGSS